MLKWFALVVIPVAAALFILPLLCVGSDMYLWTDENGQMVISSEKPPEHIKDFKTLGVIDTALESAPPSQAKAEYRDTGSQYDNFPPSVLEKINRTARSEWPRNKQMQVSPLNQQIQKALTSNKWHEKTYI